MPASTLLKSMMKEEWRVHSTLFGGIRFGTLPLLIFLFGAAGSFFGSIFREVFEVSTMVAVVQVTFLFFGMAVGGFGISGQEFMNRRFGQASLLAYSSRTLPISERKIFFSMVVKDIIYYFLIWIFPLILGFFMLEHFIHPFSFMVAAVSLISLSLSFLLGLSLVFVLSAIYARSSVLFVSASLPIAVLSVLEGPRSIMISILVPSLSVLPDITNLMLIQLSVIVFSLAVSMLLARFDFKQRMRLYSKEYPSISKSLSFTRYRFFLSKDFLDMRRSKGGMGKIIFSYAIPSVFIYFFADFFRANVLDMGITIMFSILLGVFSASIYTWITEHDIFTQYVFLPIRKSDVMMSKIAAFLVLNVVSYILVVWVALFNGEAYLLPMSIVVFSVVSLYSLSLTIFLTGLMPSVRFMDVKVLIAYVSSIIPVMLALIMFYGFFWNILIPSLIAVSCLSVFLLKKSFTKWDAIDDVMF